MALSVVLFLLCAAAIYLSCEYFVNGVEWVGRRLGVGATATGTVTIGSFRLTGGYGAWGSPNPGYLGKLTGARLTSPNGTVLATGTFAAA